MHTKLHRQRISFLPALLIPGCVAGILSAMGDDADPLQRPPATLPKDLPRLSRLLPGKDGGQTPTKESWIPRRAELRKRWQDYLGPFPEHRAPLEAQVIEKEELPRFKRERVRYQIEESIFTDGYLLTPAKGAGKLPAVVVFHSTVSSQARQPAGLDPTQTELMLGVELAERGYVALCPRCFIFDEGADAADNVAKMHARHSDWKGMARMAFDAIRAADYLESLPEVDRTKIGCMGHSLGAKEALYAAALDERYQAAVFSEGGIGIDFSNWDAIWYLGVGIMEQEKSLEHHQLLALTAPRAFLLVAGESADNDRSWAFIEAALPVYRLLEAPGSLGWLNHRQGHRFPKEARATAMEFLDRHLKR
jgi:dienelactone hydrolase